VNRREDPGQRATERPWPYTINSRVCRGGLIEHERNQMQSKGPTDSTEDLSVDEAILVYSVRTAEAVESIRRMIWWCFVSAIIASVLLVFLILESSR
jgi:hypothetical protein